MKNKCKSCKCEKCQGSKESEKCCNCSNCQRTPKKLQRKESNNGRSFLTLSSLKNKSVARKKTSRKPSLFSVKIDSPLPFGNRSHLFKK